VRTRKDVVEAEVHAVGEDEGQVLEGEVLLVLGVGALGQHLHDAAVLRAQQAQQVGLAVLRGVGLEELHLQQPEQVHEVALDDRLPHEEAKQALA
jgi:hypothetical protein